MKRVVMAVAGLVLGTAASLGVGCDGDSKLNVTIEEGPTAQRVNLPAVPTLPPPPHPVNYPDGSYSVYGARHRAASLWTKEIRVKGYIARVYVPMLTTARPPRPCREADHCTEEKPHIFIADTPNETDPEKLMMVTGYANFQADLDFARQAARSGRPLVENDPRMLARGLQRLIPSDFDQGAQIIAEGRLVRRATNGHADSNGLIDYTRHTLAAPPPDAGAPPARGH